MAKVSDSIRILAPYLSIARKEKIAEVIAGRTSSLAVLLENVTDKGNRNAVMRSMDAAGVHTLHRLNYGEAAAETVQGKNMKIRTDSGARKWISTTNWSSVDICLQHLKANGYKIASTMPDAGLKLVNVDFTERLVVAFGNEHIGVSKLVSDASDFHFSIPMTGFVQSLNLSLCVAVTLYHGYFQRLAKLGKNGDLSDEEQLRLTLQYYIQTIGAEKARNILNNCRHL